MSRPLAGQRAGGLRGAGAPWSPARTRAAVGADVPAPPVPLGLEQAASASASVAVRTPVTGPRDRPARFAVHSHCPFSGSGLVQPNPSSAGCARRAVSARSLIARTSASGPANRHSSTSSSGISNEPMKDDWAPGAGQLRHDPVAQRLGDRRGHSGQQALGHLPARFARPWRHYREPAASAWRAREKPVADPELSTTRAVAAVEVTRLSRAAGVKPCVNELPASVNQSARPCHARWNAIAQPPGSTGLPERSMAACASSVLHQLCVRRPR